MEQKGAYIVFVDLDKTLLTTNSGKVLAWAAYKKGLLSTSNLLKAISLSLLYKLKLINSLKSTELMVKWLKGIPESTVKDFGNQLVKQKLISMLRPSMLQEIERHKKQGAHIVLLSAALPYVCIPLSQYLKLNDVISSVMEIQEGLFTGKPMGKMCIEEEKEIRVRQYCLDKSYLLPEAYCYGDSYSDRFVLEIIGNPVCVAPDKRLRKLAVIKKWALLE